MKVFRFTMSILIGALVLVGADARAEAKQAAANELLDNSRLRIGVGDRYRMQAKEQWEELPEIAREHGLELDLFQMWLTRGWTRDWVKRKELEKLAAAGITPVVVHYFFGDHISKERVEAQSDAWFSSMWRLANLVRMDSPVLVVLEPEFNIKPPEGETALTDWPWFADNLRNAAKMIREQAPNALVGVCPGDFPGPPKLEGVLGPVAKDLDFIAFQEMRAVTDPDRARAGYLDVGRAATDFAIYLQRAFHRPLLLAYMAFSSYGDWEQQQARAVEGLLAQRAELQRAGVFGMIYFQLKDDPEHVGYFGKAEPHFGLLRADGSAKPALEAFRAFGRKPSPASRR